MAKLGRKHLDFAGMGKAAGKTDSMARAIVPNRVLQHDTDFACYRVAANMDDTIEQCVQKVFNIVESRRRQAGAQFAHMHLTVGLKSGRKEMATILPYQEKRNKQTNPELSYRVEKIREAISSRQTAHGKAIVSHLIEADDNLRMHQIQQIEAHGIESSVMDSGDKDLWFTEGWHMRDDGSFYLVDGYGHTEYKEVGNVKPKLIGEGTSWFWHQMIMGDSVDNIPGLVEIDNQTLDEYFPLKSGKRRKDSAGKCGEAKAYEMLKGITTDNQAFNIVCRAYKQYWSKRGKCWQEMLVEQAFLLWIRRTNKLTDVLDFLNDRHVVKFAFSEAQKTRLREYLALVKQNKDTK